MSSGRLAGSDRRARWAGYSESGELWVEALPRAGRTRLIALRGLGASAEAPMDVLRRAILGSEDDPALAIGAALAEELARNGYPAGSATAGWVDLGDGEAEAGGTGDVRVWHHREGALALLIRDQVYRGRGSELSSWRPQIVERALVGEAWMTPEIVRARFDVRPGDRVALASANVWWSVPEALLEWWLVRHEPEAVVDAVVAWCRQAHGEPIALVVAELR